MIRPAILALALLAACGSVVPATVAQLRTLSPADADPAALAVAVLTPAGLQPTRGSGRLILQSRRSDTGQADTITLTLAEAPGDAAAFGAGTGEAVRYYRVAAADQPALRAFQAGLDAWQAEVPDATQGSLSIGLGACAVDGGPAPDARGSVFIRLAADGPYLPLINRARIASLIGADALAATLPCPRH
jgi:hypothetical protein